MFKCFCIYSKYLDTLIPHIHVLKFEQVLFKLLHVHVSKISWMSGKFNSVEPDLRPHSGSVLFLQACLFQSSK